MRTSPGHLLALGSSLCLTAIAAPAAETVSKRFNPLAVPGDILGTTGSVVADTVHFLLPNIDPFAPSASILAQLESIQPGASPTDPAAASAALAAIWASPTPTNVFAVAAKYIAQGLSPRNVADLARDVAGYLDGDNSSNNINPRQPVIPVYPQADPLDAPYDVPEATLRAAIHIPAGFRYGAPGAPPPVILFPPTTTTAYEAYVGSFIPLLTNSAVGDPVWVNIPGENQGDIQTNVEYVAYAINYIYGISNQRPMGIIGFSQGGVDAQWCFKYWPSTRAKVMDNIQFSPAYHGSLVASIGVDAGLPLPPALVQQAYDSKLLAVLRADGGIDGYVPSTVVYSSFIDEAVQPTSSALLGDARNVGVTNNQVQQICKGQPGGSFYTHEGILYNPLSWALVVDALTHPGPGRPERLNLGSLCPFFISPNLTVADFLLTEELIVIAVTDALLYPNKVLVEPPIKPYALVPPPNSTTS